MNIRRAVAVLALAAASCFASEADGKWTGSIETPNGKVPMSFDLKTEGNRVSGTAVGPQGEVKITNGAFENGLISFTLIYRVYDTDVTFRYRGIVKKGAIDFQMVWQQDDPVNFTVKRVE